MIGQVVGAYAFSCDPPLFIYGMHDPFWYVLQWLKGITLIAGCVVRRDISMCRHRVCRNEMAAIVGRTMLELLVAAVVRGCWNS